MRILFTIITICICFQLFGQIKRASQADDEYELIPYLTNKGYGYADREGRLVIEPKYERANLFDSVGLAIVALDWKEGLINEKGEVMVPLIFDDDLSKNLNYVPFKDWQKNVTYDPEYKLFKGSTGTEYVIYKSGKKIIYSEAYKSTDRYGFEFFFKGGYAKVKTKLGKVNFLNLDLEEVFQKSIIDGYQIGINVFAEVGKSGRCRIIDIKSKAISGFNFKGFRPSSTGKQIIASTSSTEKYGVYDLRGNIIIDTIYDNINNIGIDLFAVKRDDKYGVINSNNTIIVDFTPNNFFPFGNGFYTVAQEGYYFYDNKGNIVSGPTYGHGVLKSRGFGVIENDSSFVIGPEGKPILIFEDKIEIICIGNDHVVIKNMSDRKYTLYDKNGKTPIGENHDVVLASRVADWCIVRDGLFGGVYSLSDGWIYPMELQIVEASFPLKKPLGSVKISRFDSIFVHETNSEVAKSFFNTNKNDHRIYYGNDSISVLFRSGRIEKYLKRKNVNLAKNRQGQVYLTKGVNHMKRLMYDSLFVLVLPPDCIDFREIDLKNISYFKGINKDGDEALFNFSGEVIFSFNKGQKIDEINSTFIEVSSSSGVIIYDENLVPILEKSYSVVGPISSINGYIKNTPFYGKSKNGYYDIFDVEGKLVSTGKYLKVRSSTGEYFSVAKGKEYFDLKCIINREGAEIYCDSVRLIIPIIDDGLKYIVHTKNGFGLLDSSGNVIVKDQNENISYKPEIESFIIKKKNKRIDVLKEGKKLVDNLPGNNFEVRRHESLLVGRTEGFYYVFDNEGTFIRRFHSFWGSLFSNRKSIKNGIIKFVNESGQRIYANIFTGRVYFEDYENTILIKTLDRN